MDVLAEHLEHYNRSVEGFILPGTLMDCFEYHRRRQMRKAAAAFNDNELSWFLHLMNELRGVADRKDDFDLLFDPVMYMVDHPAWAAAPGVLIELPPLNTAVLDRAEVGSIFQVIAQDEVARLRTLAESYPEDALIGLANVAAAAFADVQAVISDRRSAIRYLAVNASAKLEDYWATDDRPWHEAGDRIVELPDVVAEQKEQILRDKAAVAQGTVTEADLVCYTEEQIKHFAFNPDKFLLSGKTRHMPLCGSCQGKIAHWIEYVRKIEERMLSERGGRMSQN
jgi:hypothetical protein